MKKILFLTIVALSAALAGAAEKPKVIKALMITGGGSHDYTAQRKTLSEGLEEKFKISKTLATSNLVAFDSEGRITKYSSVEDILREFFALRIKFYEKRKVSNAHDPFYFLLLTHK